jgi:hypothetical protein
METGESMSVEVTDQELAQVSTKAEQVDQYTITSPEDSDFKAANLLNAGQAGSDITERIESGQMHSLQRFMSTMREIAGEEFFEKFLELYKSHQNSETDSEVLFRRRGEGGAELSFQNPDADGPYLRVSYKKSKKKGERLTIDGWFNGSPVRMRVQPTNNDNKYSFTPQMLSVLELKRGDKEKGKKDSYTSAEPNFESDAQFRFDLVEDLVDKINDALGRSAKSVSMFRPSRLKKRDDLKETVRKRTFLAIGG